MNRKKFIGKKTFRIFTLFLVDLDLTIIVGLTWHIIWHMQDLTKDSFPNVCLPGFLSLYVRSVEKTGRCLNSRTHNGVPSLAGMNHNFHHRRPYDDVLWICDQSSIDNPLTICVLMDNFKAQL